MVCPELADGLGGVCAESDDLARYEEGGDDKGDDGGETPTFTGESVGDSLHVAARLAEEELGEEAELADGVHGRGDGEEESDLGVAREGSVNQQIVGDEAENSGEADQGKTTDDKEDGEARGVFAEAEVLVYGE